MRSNPTQVGSGFYRKIAAGNNSTMAIDPYGTLSAWGENLYGQIGTNTVNNTLSWTQLSNGDTHSLALRSDGTLYAWGLNTSGQLGVGDTIARQSPTQISAKIDGVVTLTWSAVSAGASHSVAIASDGVAYGWGLNTSGQVGDITIVNRSAPVQIGIAGTQLNYSVLFNGTNQSLSVATASAFNIGTNSFTVEAWINTSYSGNTQNIFSISDTGATGYAAVRAQVLSNQSVQWLMSPSTGWGVNVTAGTIKLGLWNHIAITRNGSSVYFFINGMQVGSTQTYGTALTGGGTTYIALNSGTPFYFNGYISNFRFINGTAQYTSSFTPSVSPFSNIANTSLLTCHQSTIVDGSSNAFVITNNGTATVSSSVNPFIYYSGSFVATSSQLLTLGGQTQFAFGTGDFTIECFVYSNGTPSGYRIIDFTPAGGSGLYPAIIMRQYFWSYEVNAVSAILASASPSANTWYHVALVRITGSTKLYINGSQVGSTYADTNNYIVGTSRPVIGSTGNSLGSEMMNGYISNLRVVKGVGVYTSNFTIPTNILRTVQAAGTNITALSGTETVLLTLQDSTFIDKSNNNFTITPLNGTTISSTVVPFVAIPPAGGTGNLIASKISAGKDFTLAIKSNNTLWSWGLNTGYQLGNSITVSRSSPVQVGTSSWSQISAGASHALAIDSNNQLYGWGNNSSGQVGVNVFSWTQVAGNSGTGFAIRDDGSLWSWGINSWGQLGQNDTISNKSSPVAIGTDSWLQVSSGEQYVLAIRSDNTLWSWGINNVGQLGLDSIASRSSPVQVGTSSWSSVSAGINSSLGIKTDTTLWAWGSNGTGQLGIGLTTSRSSPVQVSSAVTTWSVISISASIAAAISTSGGLYLWGLALANGTSVNRSSPVQLGTESWSAVATGLSSAIGIDTLGRLYSWGTNTNHQLGDNSALTVSRSSPVQLGASSWSMVSAGTSSSYAITTDSRLFAWGLNSSNQLGDGTAEPRSSPVQIGTGINFTKISGGINNSYAIDNNYYLYSWGNGTGGAIGDSTVVTKIIPTQVGGVNNNTIFIKPFKIGASSWSQISAGYSHSVALTSDNQLFTWGNNTNGQLGFNMSFISISAGYSTTSVIRSDGTLWAWGGNIYGQLGDNTTVTRSSPVQVGILINWSKTTRTALTSYAIDNTGKLYAWGENSTGAIGDGTVIARSSPVQIGTSSWIMVATGGTATVGQQTAYAIRSDGALFAWGVNNYGQRGSGGAVPTSSPVQIGNSSWSVISGGNQFVMGITVDGKLYGWGLNNAGQLGVTRTTILWTKVVSSGLHTLALRSDNLLFAWGLNSSGQLGDGTTTNKSSPVQIASGSYTQISAGLSNSYAIRSDGSLWSWGDNSKGQIPLISQARSSPVQIGSGSISSVYFGSAEGLSYEYTRPTGDFTIEAWVYLATLSNSKVIAWLSPTDQAGRIQVFVQTTGALIVEQFSIGVLSTTTVTMTTNQWYHIAVVRLGTALTSYINGVSYATFVSSGTLGVAGQMFIGSSSLLNSAGGFYMSNFRYVVGTAMYTGKFIPPTGALSRIQSSGTNIAALTGSETNILTCQGSTIVDGSVNNVIIKTYGPPKIDRLLAPFTQSYTYDSWSLLSASQTLNYVLATRSDNTLYGWGNNVNSAIGSYSLQSLSNPVVQSPTQVSGGGSWTAISAGGGHSLGINSDFKLYAWGLGDIGQTAQAGTTISWSQIAVGDLHSTAIRSDGMLFTWGRNDNGQLGLGDLTNKSSPVQVGASSWSQIASSIGYTIAVRSDSTLWAWGLGTAGQLGLNDQISRSSPVQIGSVNTWSKVSAGGSNTFAIRSDGTLWAWGWNTSGSLGDGTTFSKSSPVLITTPLVSWTQIATNGVITAGINNIGVLYTWGDNTNGQLGSGTTTPRSAPAIVTGNSWISVAAGQGAMAGIDTLGKLYTWGSNVLGELGDNSATTVYRSAPLQVGSSSWTSVTSSQGTVYAITTTNILWAWGVGTSGQLGDLTTGSPRTSMVAVTGGGTYVKAIPGSHGMAIMATTYALQAWGFSTSGQLGDGTTISKSSPIAVGTSIPTILSAPAIIGTSSWTSVSAGSSHSMAIRSDGGLFAWGFNFYGQLGTTDIAATGDPATTNRSSPVQVSTGTSWTAVTAGGSHTMALRADGALFTWGLNSSGALGLGIASTIARSSPVQIGSSSWSQIAAGASVGVAILSNGSLYAWGLGTSGQLGNNAAEAARADPFPIAGVPSTPIEYSPVQVGSSSWSIVSAGDSHAVGIKIDNTVFAWGYNFHGQLGDSTVVSRSSPVQVGTVTNSLTNVNAYSTYVASTILGYYTTPANNDFALGDTWTAEFFMNGGSPNTTNYVFASQSTGAGNYTEFRMTSSSIRYEGGAGFYLCNNVSLYDNIWHHVAIVCNAGELKIYVDGIARTPTGTSTTTGYNIQNVNPFYILNSTPPVSTSSNFSGYISNFRVVKGTAVYTSNFTVPSSPLTAITNTVLLTFQNTTVVDNSTSAKTLTQTGTVIYGSLNTPFASAVAGGALFATQISAGFTHSVAIDTAGKLYTWGLGTNGQLGSGSTTARSAPTQIGFDKNWKSIAAGLDTNLAIDFTEALFSWGLGTTGQLGLSDTVTRSSPVQVTSISLPNTSSPTQVGTSSYILVNAGNNISTAISSDSKLFVWGLGTTGQLGTGLTFSRSSPVQISTNSYNLVSAGGTHTTFVPNYSPQLILSTGLNTSGQLGLSDIISRSSPTQVAASISKFNSPVTVSAGDYSSYYVSSPTQVGTSSWTQVSAGGTHTLGVKYDNTLWAWGYNANGQLGGSNTINRSSPVQVGTSSWSQVSAGDLHNTIAKSDGTINTFGLNSFGQLGDGT